MTYLDDIDGEPLLFLLLGCFHNQLATHTNYFEIAQRRKEVLVLRTLVSVITPNASNWCEAFGYTNRIGANVQPAIRGPA